MRVDQPVPIPSAPLLDKKIEKKIKNLILFIQTFRTESNQSECLVRIKW